MLYHALGLMSGSSLDGLDIAYARMEWAEGGISNWELLEEETVSFTEQWKRRLQYLPEQSALTFAKTHVYFGRYMAELVQDFRRRRLAAAAPIDFIASHGHTVFHDPGRYLTVQIGDGAALSALTGLPVLCDFRGQDVALGGEGAPLAPLADRYLFEGYDFYLNLGGIANLSSNLGGRQLGFDVCPCNQVLNALAGLTSKEYDADGEMARRGSPLPDLSARANAWGYYSQKPPKSLGNERIAAEFLPLFIEHPASVEDRSATACRHIAERIAASIKALLDDCPPGTPTTRNPLRLLLSGGGAFHTHLLTELDTCLRQTLPHSPIELVLPEPRLVRSKEALLMVLLGVLRLQRQANSLASITGAATDTVNGAWHCAPPNLHSFL